MFKKKVEDVEEPKVIIEKQFSDREVELLKTLLKIHKDEIELFRLNALASQPETVRYPHGRKEKNYIKNKRKKGSYSYLDV